MTIIDSSASSCGLTIEHEFHFLLVCALYSRPRVTLLNAIRHIAPFTLKTMLYGCDNLDLSKRIITKTLKFTDDSKKLCLTA